MIGYILRRLVWTFVLLIIITFITFIVFYLFPSADPAELRAGRNPNPDLVAAIRKQFGFDKPFYTQYWIYLKNIIFHLDFGRSYTKNQSIGSLLVQRAPVSASLALGAAVIWL